ncbi:MAG TPA: ATP-binding protein [Thermoanaerobaculia bacterium]|nr:ATP-binding protein [Thermoanaerobaculia bacterium]
MLQLVQRLLSLGSPEDILETIAKECLHLTDAARSFASYNHAGRPWDVGAHVECDRLGARRATPAARSALYAIHRRLSLAATPLEIARSEETEPMFRGLECGADVETLHAVPIIHRTGRVWGCLVLVRGDRRLQLDTAPELAQLATVALENVQRLDFARRDQDRLLLLAEATSDAFYDWNFDTGTFWWGGGVIKLLNADNDPVENTPRWRSERIHPDDADRVQSSLDEARSSKAMTWTEEYRFRRGDGSFIHVEDRGYFLREPDGRGYRIIGSIRDVTAMKDLLAREQRARSEAEAANHAKDDFLAMLSHELRTPMTAILGWSRVLQESGVDDATFSDAIESILRSAQAQALLIDDVLDMSRIIAGKMQLDPQPVDLADPVQAAMQTVQPAADAKGVLLEFQRRPGTSLVSGDPNRLQQIVWNLLSNAIKFTPRGGEVVARVEPSGSFVRMSVRDTGKGIAPEFLPHVFEPFRQAENVTTRVHGGLGLGLAIVKQLVELHGGNLSAHSEGDGKGATFVVEFPVRAIRGTSASQKAERERYAPQKTAIPSRFTYPSLSGVRVLIVDDQEDARLLVRTVLGRCGATVEVACSVADALAVLEHHAPDVIVSDIAMPDADGFALLREIREARKLTLPVIAMTAFGHPADQEKILAAGFSGYLRKPVEPYDLARELHWLIARRH